MKDEGPIRTPHSGISIDKHIAQARRIKRLEAQRNGCVYSTDAVWIPLPQPGKTDD